MFWRKGERREKEFTEMLRMRLKETEKIERGEGEGEGEGDKFGRVTENIERFGKRGGRK